MLGKIIRNQPNKLIKHIYEPVTPFSRQKTVLSATISVTIITERNTLYSLANFPKYTRSGKSHIPIRYREIVSILISLQGQVYGK